MNKRRTCIVILFIVSITIVGIIIGGQLGGKTDSLKWGKMISVQEEEQIQTKENEIVYLLAKTTFYRGNGSLEQRIEYEYDENGKVMKESTYIYYKEDEWCLYDQSEYEYQESGNISQYYYTYSNDNNKSLCLKENYDKDGNVIGVYHYNDGDLEYEDIYEYDENRNLMLISRCSSSGDLMSMTKYTYDENKNPLVTYRYEEDGSIDWYKNYECDSDGNVVEEYTYKGDGNLDWYEKNEFDINGNLVQSCNYNSDGSLNYRVKYEYDEKGNELKGYRYKEGDSLDGFWENEYNIF